MTTSAGQAAQGWRQGGACATPWHPLPHPGTLEGQLAAAPAVGAAVVVLVGCVLHGPVLAFGPVHRLLQSFGERRATVGQRREPIAMLEPLLHLLPRLVPVLDSQPRRLQLFQLVVQE